MKIVILTLMLLLAGCRFPDKEERLASRIFPPGDGRVVQFDLAARANEPLMISSKNVQAQRRGNNLLVNFDQIDFARSPQASARELVLNDFTVRVSRRQSDGTLQQLAQADEGLLDNHALTAEQPGKSLRGIQVEIKDTGTACNLGCVIALAANYGAAAAASLAGMTAPPPPGRTSAESTAVQIKLETGEVTSLGAPAAVASQPAPRREPRVKTGCLLWATEAEASEALGQPTRYRDAGATPCMLEPAGGSGITLQFVIDQDVSGFYQQTAAPLAEMLGGVGDRAVWNPGERLLTVIKDKRRLAITVSGSPDGAAGVRQKVTALARIIAQRM